MYNSMYTEFSTSQIDDFLPDISWPTSWAHESNSSPDDINDSSSKSSKRRLSPNLTRRSHKKSRHGCYSCKSRKIKCDESSPTCGNCEAKHAECVYPTQPPRRDVVGNRRPTAMLSTSPGLVQFSLNDIQFFHHFLTLACPHLPLGNDDVWLREIPQFAQEHTYLMHAMLGLGASHLDRMLPVSLYQRDALIHRGHAINGFNKALAKRSHEYGEADAMLATCYALTFQSSYMKDGLQDFITFVRGCALATNRIRVEETPTAFDLTPDRHFDVVEPRLERLPNLEPNLVSEGLQAIQTLQAHLRQDAEYKFYSALTAVFRGLGRSSREGYLNFISMYTVWYDDMCHDSFKTFLDKSNSTMQVLLAFFIGTQMLMVPLTVVEWPERARDAPVKMLSGMHDWMDSVSEKVPTELQHHLGWPKMILNKVSMEVSGLTYEGSSILQGSD